MKAEDAPDIDVVIGPQAGGVSPCRPSACRTRRASTSPGTRSTATAGRSPGGWTSRGRATEGSWRAVVAITRGGMAPAMIVARELDIRTVDTISVKSYDWQKQAEAEVLKAPDAGLMGDGTGILVVDDLVDTGKTLELVRRLYPKAHFATVYAKPQGRPMVDTYITEVSQDTWISSPGTWRCSTCGPIAGSSGTRLPRS